MNLENAVVGDELFVSSYGAVRNRYEILVVERITKTQVISGSDKFRKSDGRKVGSDSWYGGTASLATDENKEKVSNIKERDSVIRKFRNFNIMKLPTESLRIIAKEIDAYKEST